MEGFAGTGGGSDVEFELVVAGVGVDVGLDEGIDEVAGEGDRAVGVPRSHGFGGDGDAIL